MCLATTGCLGKRKLFFGVTTRIRTKLGDRLDGTLTKAFAKRIRPIHRLAGSGALPAWRFTARLLIKLKKYYINPRLAALSPLRVFKLATNGFFQTIDDTLLYCLKQTASR